MDKKTISADIDTYSSRLFGALMDIPEEKFNLRTENFPWSAGDIAEHLLLLETLVNNRFEHTDDTQRDPALKVAAMERGFANPKRKNKAPEFIEPGDQDKDRQQMISSLQIQRNLLKANLDNHSLDAITEYRHPVIGDMSRLEWIYFVLYHGDKHARQLNALRKELE